MASLNASQHGSTQVSQSPAPTSSTNLKHLSDRVSALEDRFPLESEIDKYATVNDALLDSGLTHLRERVVRIEVQMLTRWDVAVVVFSVIAAIGVLSSAVFGVAAYLKD